MKKYLIGLFAIVLCLTLVGCGKGKENENENEENIDTPVVGGWQILLTDSQVAISEDELGVFNKAASSYTDLKLEPVALIGKQVVAGTNYMFFAKGSKDNVTKYKVVVIYNDLQGNATVSKVVDFDLTKYAGVEYPKKYAENEGNTGAWELNTTGKALVLEDESVQSSFDKASEKLDSMIFNPICTLGKQIVAGTNYAILTYGKGTNSDLETSLYVATLYVDLQGNADISYLYYLNIADFNS